MADNYLDSSEKARWRLPGRCFGLSSKELYLGRLIKLLTDRCAGYETIFPYKRDTAVP